ncbi:MAG: hypothetical protein AB1400_05780 [Pseudomonadota bacterium]
MKLSCPACGSLSSLDALLGNEGAREAVMAALAMPAPIGKIMVQYLGLFRPAQRQLSFDRVATLINELLPMIHEAKIERHGRIWSAPQDYWRMGMEEMLAKRDRLTLPLKNHGYLLSIIEGYSQKAEARTETQTEARRAGHTPVGGTAAHQPVPVVQQDKPRSPMPESVKAALNKSTKPKGESRE